MTVMSVSGCHV